MNTSTLECAQPSTHNGSNHTLACTVCTALGRLAYQHPEADIFRCPDCGHCFSDTNSIRQHEAYGDAYHENAHKNWMENPNLKLFKWLERQIVRCGPQSSVPQPSVLDIGCGRAQFLGYLAERHENLQLTGIELDRFEPPAA